MNNKNLIFTVFSKDRPGIIKSVSDTVLGHQGNWLESQFSRLCGRFTGIAKVSIPDHEETAFTNELMVLAKQGITITVHSSTGLEESTTVNQPVAIEVEANDRPGIVDEIASALSAQHINIEKLTTECESASMAGYSLFKATVTVTLPQGVSEEALESVLEGVSDDVMVSFS